MPTTVSDLLRLLLTHYESNSQPIAANLRYQLPKICEFFGDRDVDTLTFADFEEFKAWRIAQGVRQKTVNNELGYLARANRLGLRAKLCASLFDMQKFRIGLENARTDFLQPEQVREICLFLTFDVRHVVEFAYQTGWRKREVLDLEWKAVNAKEGFIFLEPRRSKNRRARLTPIEGRVATILEHRDRRRAGPLVFHRDGKRIKDFSHAWKTACKKAGCEGVTFHCCRRSFVRNAVRAGVDRDIAMELSGHLTADVFRRYNIVDESDLQAGARKMAGYVRNRDPGYDRKDWETAG